MVGLEKLGRGLLSCVQFSMFSTTALDRSHPLHSPGVSLHQ